MREPKAEAHLKNGAYTFRFEARLRLDTIDLKSAQENETRLYRKLDQDRVNQMALALKRGDELPAIVVMETNKELYELATGLHRITAAIQANKKTLDAYIVTESTPSRRFLLAANLNSIEGVASTKDELSHSAYIYMKKFNKTKKEAAEAFSLNAGSFGNFERRAGLEDRAKSLGRDVLHLPERHKHGLWSITNDEILVQAIDAITSTKSRANEVDDLLKKVKDARTENSKRLAIANFASMNSKRFEVEVAAKYGNRRRGFRPADQLKASLAKINLHPDVNKLGLDTILPERLPDWISDIDQAITTLEAVKDDLESRQKIEEKKAARREPVN